MANININDESFSVNDLIYLFIDGEATETERAVLFSALAKDPMLQTEFAQALAISNSVSSSSISQPDEALTAGIFSSIGIASYSTQQPIQATLAAKSLRERLISSLFSKAAINSVLSAILGALVFYLFNIGFDPNTNSDNLIASSRSDQGKSINTLNHNTNGKNSSSTNKFLPTDSLSQDVINRFDQKVGKGSLIATDYNRSKYNSTSLSRIADASVLNNASSEHGIVVKTDTIVRIEYIYIDRFSDLHYAHSEKNSNSDRVAHNDLEFSQFDQSRNMMLSLLKSSEYRISTFDSFETINKHETEGKSILEKFEISIRGMHDLSYLPDRELFLINENYSNLGGAIIFNFDDCNALGFEIAKERYPIYKLNGNNLLEPRNSINRFGIVYRHLFSNIWSIPNIRPYVATNASFANLGFFGSGELGLSWNPDSKVTFFVGANLSGFINNFKGSTELGGKYGINYGVSIRY